MRGLGDIYVKHEFHLNHTKSTEQQYREFYAAWLGYYQQLQKAPTAKEMGRQLTTEELGKLTLEQQDNLKKLK
ncbi:MAG: LYR motif-containing protein [Actinobacteria bacterium]|nr:LYR motif-containing protein [Actinomycetota bacterium]